MAPMRERSRQDKKVTTHKKQHVEIQLTYFDRFSSTPLFWCRHVRLTFLGRGQGLVSRGVFNGRVLHVLDPPIPVTC